MPQYIYKIERSDKGEISDVYFANVNDALDKLERLTKPATYDVWETHWVGDYFKKLNEYDPRRIYERTCTNVPGFVTYYIIEIPVKTESNYDPQRRAYEPATETIPAPRHVYQIRRSDDAYAFRLYASKESALEALRPYIQPDSRGIWIDHIKVMNSGIYERIDKYERVVSKFVHAPHRDQVVFRIVEIDLVDLAGDESGIDEIAATKPVVTLDDVTIKPVIAVYEVKDYLGRTWYKPFTTIEAAVMAAQRWLMSATGKDFPYYMNWNKAPTKLQRFYGADYEIYGRRDADNWAARVWIKDYEDDYYAVIIERELTTE